MLTRLAVYSLRLKQEPIKSQNLSFFGLAFDFFSSMLTFFDDPMGESLN